MDPTAAADVEAVRQVLYRYCRGLDRMDRALVAGCFADGATVDYLTIFAGTAEAFIDEVWERHRAHLRHSHQIANVLVTPRGDELASEAYVTVTLWIAGEAGLVERVVRGRYLDAWVRTGSGWQIARRTFVADHRSDHPLPSDAVGPLLASSTRDHLDPSHAVLGDLDAPAGEVRPDAGPTGVARLVEVERIKALKSRYLHALDRNRWDELSDCLTDDVRVAYASGAMSRSGREDVLEFLRGTTLASSTTWSSHVATNPQIELLSAERARGTWRLTDLVHDQVRGSLLLGAAIYTDEYVRTATGWRISVTGYDRLLEVRLPV